ncbi:MAG: hypothetical protein M3Q15_04950 [Pseudomonadota bacterium]|nr:hypothetical protein [Pseudomonadota bacterium]
MIICGHRAFLPDQVRTAGRLTGLQRVNRAAAESFRMGNARFRTSQDSSDIARDDMYGSNIAANSIAPFDRFAESVPRAG